MNRIKSIILSTKDREAKYDAVAKALLAEKQILARLLKRFVPEFADIALEKIEKLYIEAVQVSEVEVEQNRSNIEPLANEDKTLNEGTIYYDVLFKVYFPKAGGQGGYLGMFIDLEPQNKYRVPYPIEKRGMFNAARRFSSQLKSLSEGVEYHLLEKVYSIWICMGDDVPDYESNTVTLYHTEKCDILGTVAREKDIYDMMNVIIIRINDRVPAEDDFLKLLQTLFSNSINGHAKLEELENLGINVNEEIKKGVCSMSNLVVASV